MPRKTPNEERSVRQTQAKLTSLKPSQLHQAASSTAHSPTAEGVQPSTNRIAGQAPSLTAIATQAAWSEADGYLETAPVRVEAEQLVREKTMSSCAAIRALLAGYFKLTRQAKSSHASLPETHGYPYQLSI